MKHRLFANIIGVLLALTLFASCSDDASSDTALDTTASGLAYIQLAQVTLEQQAARTVLPESVVADSLINLTLSERMTTDGAATILATADSIAELSAQTIEIAAGKHTFLLTAEHDGITFSGTTERTAQAEKTVPLYLTLFPAAGSYGGLAITVTCEGKASQVTALLKDKSGTPQGEEETLAITQAEDGNGGTVTFERAFSENSGLLSGVYTVQIQFKGDEQRDEIGTTYTTVLNMYTESVRVEGGFTSRAERTLVLNALYDITWQNGDGSLKSGFLSGQYSRKSGTISLPDMKKTGFIFGGWYTDAGFTNRITEIPSGSTGNLTLYAQWKEPKLYVSANGNDDTGDGTEANPFATIAQATAHMEDAELDYTVYILGTLMGAQTVPDTLSSDASDSEATGFAKSVTLEGATGADADVLDGGGIYIAASGADVTLSQGALVTGNTCDYGGGLYVNSDDTDPPAKVILEQNVAIEANTAQTYGGGVYINKNATVLMNDSARIANNTATSQGGGMQINDASSVFKMAGGSITGNRAGTDTDGYDGGGVFIAGGKMFMYGTTVIGDASATSAATSSAYSNYAKRKGGGICTRQRGALYMGYSDETTETPLAETVAEYMRKTVISLFQTTLRFLKTPQLTATVCTTQVVIPICLVAHSAKTRPAWEGAFILRTMARTSRGHSQWHKQTMPILHSQEARCALS